MANKEPERAEEVLLAELHAARVSYLKAIHAARNQDFRQAQEHIEKGDLHYDAGYAAHCELLQQECSGAPSQVTLTMLHAEDQLVSAESCKIMALESLHIYRSLAELQQGNGQRLVRTA